MDTIKKIELFGVLRMDSNGCLSVALPRDISLKMDKVAKYKITIERIQKFESKHGRVVVVP